MKRFFHPFTLAVFGALILSACIPSMCPITEKNETFLPEVEGTWTLNGNRYQVELNGDFYAVSVQTKQGKKEFYKMTLAAIDGETYASVTFDRDAPELKKILGNDASEPFSLPIWRLYRLRFSNNELRLCWMHSETDFQKCLRELGAFQKKGSTDPILNTTPDQLKAWLAKNESAFAETKDNFFLFKRSR